MKYHLVILGCQMNYSDAERIRTVLENMGFEQTDDENDANLIGIVACSVRQKAIDKVYGKIHKWNLMKKKRHLFTFASGCILESDELKFAKLFDLIFHMEQLPQLPELLRQIGVIANQYKLENEENFWKITPAYTSDIEAFIPIQNGCNNFCTYCAVPYTRGREISRSSEDILAELKFLVEKGTKVISLLGQNVNSYGLDKKGEEISFAELLSKIGEFGLQSGKEFWLYFTAPHPHDMTEEVLQIMAKYPHIAKQLHLPIQSGDNEILQKMNRNYTIEDFSKVVEKFRFHLPTATLFTDVIVGFASETLEQFENTIKSIEKFRYNMAFVAMYSPRPGARSAKWDDDISHLEKSRRHQEFNKNLQSVAQKLNAQYVGKTVRVLVESKDGRQKDALRGKTEGRLIVRILSNNEKLIGQFCNVKITESAVMSLTGIVE